MKCEALYLCCFADKEGCRGKENNIGIKGLPNAEFILRMQDDDNDNEEGGRTTKMTRA